MPGLASVISAFGLSSAAGLNAFIPLLTMALLAHFGVVHLAEPFAPLASWPSIAVLTALLGVEVVIDKVPGADHVNDVAQTLIRPAAGAVLFAAEAGLISEVPAPVWLALGLVTALGVHGVKTAARPVITASTLGLGTPIVSAAEDTLATVATFLAIFLPIVFFLFAVLVIALAVMGYRALRRAKASRAPELA